MVGRDPGAERYGGSGQKWITIFLLILFPLTCRFEGLPGSATSSLQTALDRNPDDDLLFGVDSGRRIRPLSFTAPGSALPRGQEGRLESHYDLSILTTEDEFSRQKQK